MSDFRIVFNETTGQYRVEKRGWFGWNFVTRPSGEGYASFDDFEAARLFACEARCGRRDRYRRWRVIDICREPGR